MAADSFNRGLCGRRGSGLCSAEFLSELLDLFGARFAVFEDFIDAGGDVGAGDGESAGDGVEESVVAAGGADSTEAADELDAPALADFFDAAQQDCADLAGAADMRAA